MKKLLFLLFLIILFLYLFNLYNPLNINKKEATIKKEVVVHKEIPKQIKKSPQTYFSIGEKNLKN
ncbi:MAG: hypothetical protein IKN42_07695, partial [Elusimicrobia bacterium]|nr:hypothetical protein [Elusimicrobiota bacterium]